MVFFIVGLILDITYIGSEKIITPSKNAHTISLANRFNTVAFCSMYCVFVRGFFFLAIKTIIQVKWQVHNANI